MTTMNDMFNQIVSLMILKARKDENGVFEYALNGAYLWSNPEELLTE